VAAPEIIKRDDWTQAKWELLEMKMLVMFLSIMVITHTQPKASVHGTSKLELQPACKILIYWCSQPK
jgi:hypothetical protein